MTEKCIDVCAVTETWINKDTTQETLKATIPDGYAILSQPTQDGHRGGGWALIYKKESAALIDFSSIEIGEAECSVFNIRINQSHFDICVVYKYHKGSVLSVIVIVPCMMMMPFVCLNIYLLQVLLEVPV